MIFDTPLFEARCEGDQTPTKDEVGKMWRKYKVPIRQTAFKSISETWFDGDTGHDYFRHSLMFLGGSPDMVKDKRYAAPHQESFGEAIKWLRSQVLSVEMAEV